MIEYKKAGAPYTGCSIRIMAYNGDGFLLGFDNFYDHPEAVKFMRTSDNLIVDGDDLIPWQTFINDHWDYRIWAVDYVLGDRTIGGMCNNLVTMMKLVRLLAYKALVGDGLISGPEDLLLLVQRFHPDAGEHLLAFEKEERFWEYMQNGGYEDKIWSGQVSAEEEKTLTDKLIALVESEYED